MKNLNEMFFKTKIPHKVVDLILDTININKQEITPDLENCTVKGFQTSNINHLFNNDLKKQILDNNCLYQDIFHIHYIEYSEGGFQLIHNHEQTEVYSFILYLNDAVGDTVFEHTRVSPEKGVLLIFDSRLKHSGEKSLNKKILVGAINKI